jgi:hypothetical protein
MNHNQLEYYIHDNRSAFRLKLAGSLGGAGVKSVHDAWRTALSTLRGRPVIADISLVTAFDTEGHELLMLWHEAGVHIVGPSPLSNKLPMGIVKDADSGSARRRSWRQHMTEFLTRCFVRVSICAANDDRATDILASAGTRP